MFESFITLEAFFKGPWKSASRITLGVTHPRCHEKEGLHGTWGWKPKNNNFIYFFCSIHKQKILASTLCSSKLTLCPSPCGCSPCGAASCQLCKSVWSCHENASCSTNYSLSIKRHIDCRSSKVIYIIHCALCNMQHIGERENERKVLRSIGYKPAAVHFNLYFHDISKHIRVAIIEGGFRREFTKRNR